MFSKEPESNAEANEIPNPQGNDSSADLSEMAKDLKGKQLVNLLSLWIKIKCPKL